MLMIGAPQPCLTAVTFLARTSGLDATHTNAYAALICGLVDDGIWTKLDALYVFATQDQTTANLNLVSTSLGISPQGSPTWTADRGYAGVENGSGVYLFNNFTPSGTLFTTNNAHASVWSNSSGQSVGEQFSLFGGGGGIIQIEARNTSDQAKFFLNSTSGITVTSTNGIGFFAVNMSGGNTLDAYKDGSSVGTLSIAASGSWGGPLPYLASNNFPGTVVHGTGNQISAASLGDSLTATEHANLSSRVHTFMTAVGN